MVAVRHFNFLGLVLGALAGHGQVAPPTSPAGPTHRFYLGLEGSLFANQLTRFSEAHEYLAAERSNLVVAPALLLGYQWHPRWAVEVRVQDLPVLAGYQYQRDTPAGYLGFGQSYTQDYLYLPVLGVWRALGPQARLSLSVLAGGGPAWTDTSPSLITPNGTTVHYDAGGGGMGSGPTAPPGATVLATTTQLLTRQQGFVVALEAGVRGTWQVLPRLALDLTVRQLWGLTSSARDLDLTIEADGRRYTTTLAAPVRGVCTGLGLRYLL